MRITRLPLQDPNHVQLGTSSRAGLVLAEMNSRFIDNALGESRVIEGVFLRLFWSSRSLWQFWTFARPVNRGVPQQVCT